MVSLIFFYNFPLPFSDKEMALFIARVYGHQGLNIIIP